MHNVRNKPSKKIHHKHVSQVGVFDYQVLDIRDIHSIFRDIRPDLNEEVEKIFEKTGRTAWNKMRKLQASPGAYASYDFYRDPDQLLTAKVVPCYSSMLTPEICRKIQESYNEDFAAQFILKINSHHNNVE